MRAKQAKSKELTGWHVLAYLLIFFGVMVAVNIYFTVAAVRSFRGEDVPRSYRQGLEYNQTLDARAAQAAMGWTAAVNTVNDSGRLIVKIQTRDGGAPAGLTLTGGLRHPVDTDRDRPLIFVPRGAGVFTADITDIPGDWTLQGRAQSGTQRFDFNYALRVN